MTDKNRISLLSEVEAYYSQKLAQYGDTPRGVDWNGRDSQFLRFQQLCKIIDIDNEEFSVNDLGCGYGALLEFLAARYQIFSYLGVDLSADMIEKANDRYRASKFGRFVVAKEIGAVADYGMASGIFNVRLGRNDHEWNQYINDTLDDLDRTSRRGFAFNCLTTYSDEDKKRDYLFYADPSRIFDNCKRRYSRRVALLHDYDLFEFTILVRKSS